MRQSVVTSPFAPTFEKSSPQSGLALVSRETLPVSCAFISLFDTRAASSNSPLISKCAVPFGSPQQIGGEDTRSLRIPSYERVPIGVAHSRDHLAQ